MKINSNYYNSYKVNFMSKGSCEKKVAEKVSSTKAPYYCMKPYYLERKSTLLSDNKEFSKYLENKIKKQMMVKTEEDIQNLIDDVVLETNADEKLVSEVLGRVVQFSSFNQLSEIQRALLEEDIQCFAQISTHNLNSILNYLSEEKNLIVLKGDYSALFVEKDNLDIIADHYEEEKDSESVFYPAKYFIVDGWNYKDEKNKNKSYTMFGEQGNLKDTVVSIVNTVQKTNKSIDEVLNQDIIEEFKKRCPDAELKIIKNNNLKEYNAKTISQIMEPSYPTAKQIESTIDVFVEKYRPDLPKDKKKLLLNIYLDSMISCYSPQTLDVELKKKYQAIERKVRSLGKTMDDVYYVVPRDDKSFGIITYQYSKVNNIPQEKIVNAYAYEEVAEDKVIVVLDDFVGSGESMYEHGFRYFSFLDSIKNYSNPEKTSNIIFAPIFCMQEGKDNIEFYIKNNERVGQDFLLANKVISFDKVMIDHLSRDRKRKLADVIGGMGYSHNGACVSFPSSIPDNNTGISSLINSRNIKDSDKIEAFLRKFSLSINHSFIFSTTFKEIERRVNDEN